jgi:hypothetical protein
MRGNIQKPLLAKSWPGMGNTVPPGKRNRRSPPNDNNRNGETKTGRLEVTKISRQRSEVGGQTTDDRSFKVVNIEPQNDEVITSIFEIPCSIFCGLNRQQFRYGQFRLLLS